MCNIWNMKTYLCNMPESKTISASNWKVTKAYDKAILKNGMASWKIVSVLTEFWESSPGKFDLFFFLLENLMCSNEILDKILMENISDILAN